MKTVATADIGRGLLRALHVQTIFGDINGSVQMSPALRTLDDLNTVSRDFVLFRQPRGTFKTVRLRGGLLALNKSSILFVSEREDCPLSDRTKIEAGLFSRASVALWVGDYQVSGFLHVPRGGEALARLNQMTRPFLAVTSASVTGPECEMELPFVAVNRMRILAAEDLLPDAGSAGTLSFDPVEAEQ